jgi:hypothetical protein
MKKCLGINTPIIMFDGSIKMVQDIKINDLIMGDDSRSRKIVRTISGNDEMFKVITRTGDFYIVNSNYILTFKVSKYIIPDRNKCFLFCADKNGSVIQKSFDLYEDAKKEYDSLPDFVDLPVSLYIENRYWNKHFQAIYTSLDFPEKKLEIDPYTFGTLLVGGNRFLNIKNTITYFKILCSKHIPHKYKNSSKEQRLKLLAGLIDTSGRLTQYNNYEIVLEKSGKFSEDIFFIAKSLGLYVFIREQNIVCISCGCINEIPVLITKKTTDTGERFGHLSSFIRIVEIGRGSYYGLEIEHNKRFVLGNFIIT